MLSVKITNVRGNFLNLAEQGRPFQEDGEPKYSGDFIISKDSKVIDRVTKKVTTLDAVFKAEAKERWKSNAERMLASFDKKQMCLRDGNTSVNKNGEVRAGYEGHQYITAKNKDAPSLYSAGGARLTDKAEIVDTFRSGDYMDVFVDINATDINGIRGVFAKLQGVQFRKRGEPLGGGRPVAADEVEDLSIDASPEDLAS